MLGLRNDRAKFIRPFASCKSAKLMLDPVTGVSHGYGFVRCVVVLLIILLGPRFGSSRLSSISSFELGPRSPYSHLLPALSSLDRLPVPIRRFTDEADQQRALIEMHGLYCLSRPSAHTPFFLFSDRTYVLS